MRNRYDGQHKRGGCLIMGFIASFVVVLLGAAKCETQPTTAEPHTVYLNLETGVDPSIAPYTVTVVITGGVGYYPKEPIPIAAGEWSHPISYKSGKKLSVTLTVHASKRAPTDSKSHGYCRIRDGAHVTERRIYALENVVCQTETKQ